MIFGLNCSPFLLGASLNHHIRKYQLEDPTFVRALLESLYVDDMISGDNEVNGAFELYMKSKLCLADGGFNLRKWRSSSQKLIELFEGNEANETEHKRPELIEVQPFVEDETSFTKTTLGDTNEIKPDHHKVLGLTWNFIKDEFVFDFEELISVAKTLTFTKRNLLRLTAMFFDPIGFISPVIIEMKIVLQEITVLKLGWDTPLPEHIIQQWKYWVNQLEATGTIRIPRCYFSDQANVISYDLQGFCDASTKAMCALIYLICTYDSGDCKSTLLTSKAKVAPLKKLSIPRLKLTAAVILSRLIKTVQIALSNQIEFNEVFCWGDSTIVLAWLKNDRKYKQFVSNRTQEILKLTRPEMWRHCPTDSNPADIGTRGESPVHLKENPLWFHGPSRITESQDSWPDQLNSKQLIDTDPQEFAEELRNEPTVNLFTKQLQTVNLENIIEISAYSSLSKLLRVTGLIVRFRNNLKLCVLKNRDELKYGEVSAEEVQAAERLWIRSIQESLSNERNYDQLHAQLGLFRDEDGIVRCRGRIGNADLQYQSKFPAFLPRNRHLTTIIIRQCHKNVFHNGLKSTLNELRAKLRITKARHRVKSVLKNCTLCRRYEAKPYVYPPPYA